MIRIGGVFEDIQKQVKAEMVLMAQRLLVGHLYRRASRLWLNQAGKRNTIFGFPASTTVTRDP
jgi:hypothetical protein